MMAGVLRIAMVVLMPEVFLPVVFLIIHFVVLIIILGVP